MNPARKNVAGAQDLVEVWAEQDNAYIVQALPNGAIKPGDHLLLSYVCVVLSLECFGSRYIRRCPCMHRTLSTCTALSTH
jgi:hypothetical protein